MSHIGTAVYWAVTTAATVGRVPQILLSAAGRLLAGGGRLLQDWL
jgi:hypothetical protein